MPKTNKVKLEILMTTAQRKDILRTLKKYQEHFNIDEGRALQLIIVEAENTPLEMYEI